MRLAPYFIGYLLRHASASALSVIAIALGVALGVGVHAVNRAALDEFERGMRTLSGEADLEVRGGAAGFDEALYPLLARLPEVEVASPALEATVKVAGRSEALAVLGVDIFRAARLAPALLPPGGGEARLAMLDADAVFLSPAAAQWLGLDVGGRLGVQAGLALRELRVAGLLPAIAGGQRLAVMDIAAAQWRLERLGVVTRLDLRLREGVDARQAQARIAALLPAGVQVSAPPQARERQAGFSRAYRVNLTMLAMVALLTGALLVFAAQALAVVRRRSELAYLRAAGMTRRQLVAWLVAEGAAVGALGSVTGVGLGYAIGAVVLATFGADLGAGYFSGGAPRLALDATSAAGFALLGVAVACLGALAPALEAAGAPPALALKAGDEGRVATGFARSAPGLAVLALAVALAYAPPVQGLPVFGYASVALMLVGAVVLMPGIVLAVFSRLPVRGGAAWQLAVGQLRHAPGRAAAVSAGVLGSVGLACAMAIMVASFRDSVDVWLKHVLPAELYVRAALPNVEAYLKPDEQAVIAAMAGVATTRFVRYDKILLDQDKPPVALLARDLPADPGEVLALVAREAEGEAGLPRLWASEAMADLHGYRVGAEVEIPLAGRPLRMRVAGLWRDYARQHGALVMDLALYRRVTGDERVTEADLWLAPGARVDELAQRLRAALPGGERLEIVEPGAIRATSLRIFDRTFAVTYVLETVAVVIGLAGVGAGFAAMAALRRREFGMLRHVGMTRREIGAMLAVEGALTAGLGVAVGLALGGALSVVLVHVVNRQSFHWSMDMKVPWGSLAGFALTMVALATVAAVVSARQAMRADAVRAVREDW